MNKKRVVHWKMPTPVHEARFKRYAAEFGIIRMSPSPKGSKK